MKDKTLNASDLENLQIEDIISMLDGFVADGGGHMNIEVDENLRADLKTQENRQTVDCTGGACSIPTLHKGIDDEESDF